MLKLIVIVFLKLQQLIFVLLHPLIIRIFVCNFNHFVLVFADVERRLGTHGLVQVFEPIQLLLFFISFLNLKPVQIFADLRKAIQLLVQLVLNFTVNLLTRNSL